MRKLTLVCFCMQRSNMLIGVCRIGGFGFDFKNAGFTFVYVSGRQGQKPKSKAISCLPETYTNVKPAFLKSKANPPILQTPMSMFDLDYLVRNLRLEYEWFQACRHIRVSASSWVQGAIKSVSIALLLTTFSSLVTTSMMKCLC
jgi:hypothetical protein